MDRISIKKIKSIFQPLSDEIDKVEYYIIEKCCKSQDASNVMFAFDHSILPNLCRELSAFSLWLCYLESENTNTYSPTKKFTTINRAAINKSKLPNRFKTRFSKKDHEVFDELVYCAQDFVILILRLYDGRDYISDHAKSSDVLDMLLKMQEYQYMINKFI